MTEYYVTFQATKVQYSSDYSVGNRYMTIISHKLDYQTVEVIRKLLADDIKVPNENIVILNIIKLEK